jgi:peptide/nickel transport system permease protein
MMKKLNANPLFIAGVSLAFLLCLIALFGDAAAPNDPNATDILNTLAPPGGDYPLGTDNLGRCVLSRLLAGAGVTLRTALLTELIIFTVGLTAGVLAGYFGGAADACILMVIDTLLAFPSVILALVIAGMLGPGLRNLMAAMCAVYWVEHARIARSLARSLRERTFVLAARGCGSGHAKVLARHILPHMMPQMLVYSTLNVSSILIGISSLSFIGLGVRPPQAEWGALLSEARAYMDTRPVMAIAAILCVLLSVASFQLMGDALADAMEVRKNLLGVWNVKSRKHI